METRHPADWARLLAADTSAIRHIFGTHLLQSLGSAAKDAIGRFVPFGAG